MCFTKWEKSDAISLLISAIIPAILTAAFALIGYFYIENRDKREREINSINDTINSYNLLMIKSIKRNNSLMKLFEILMQHNNRFANEPYLNQIVESWENKSKETILFSNSKKFIKFESDRINELIININEASPILSYIEKMEKLPEDIDKFSNNDSIFIFKLRSILLLSNKDKSILTTYCDNFGTNYLLDKAIKEYNLSISEYILKKQYGQLNNDILIKTIENIIFRHFYLLDTIIFDSFLLFNFKTILIKEFEQYHKNKLKKYKILDEMIKPFVTNEMILKTKEYIDMQKIYEYFKIDIKDDERKMV